MELETCDEGYGNMRSSCMIEYEHESSELELTAELTPTPKKDVGAELHSTKEKRRHG